LQPVEIGPASSADVLMVTLAAVAQEIAGMRSVSGIPEKQPAVARAVEMLLMLGYDGTVQGDVRPMFDQKVGRYVWKYKLTPDALHPVFDA
jgi:hypothetical protein